MANRIPSSSSIPLNHIFTIPFDTQPHQFHTLQHTHYPLTTSSHRSVAQQTNCACQHDVSGCSVAHIIGQNFHPPLAAHGNSHCHHGGAYHPQHEAIHGASTTTRGRPSGRPLLLAMSIDSGTLAVADSLNMISTFVVDPSDDKLSLACISRASSSMITALAISEGGSTILFVEQCAPAVLRMFNTSDPSIAHEVNPVHECQDARVVSCSISSHFILASFYSERTSARTMALWRRAHNRIDSKLTQVFNWDAERVGSGCHTSLFSPVYVTEWHKRGDHSEYNAEVAYYVDGQLVYHPEVGNERCTRPSCIRLDQKPIAIRIDQSHGRDCVYVLSGSQLRIFRALQRSQLREVDCVDFGNRICSSAVCGIWKGRRNRHVTVARIVNGQVMVFQAQLSNGLRLPFS